LQQTGKHVNKNELTKIIKDNFSQKDLVEEDKDEISVGEITFRFKGDQLESIELLINIK